MTDISTTPTTEGAYQGEDWLLDLENLSPADAEFLAQREARHKRVGELLRELHYLDTSEPPSGMVRAWYPSEEAFWAARGFMSPGLSVERLEAALLMKKSASSTAEQAATTA